MSKQTPLTNEQKKAYRDKYDSIKSEDVDLTDPDARLLPQEAWAKAKPLREWFRPIKEVITIRVDADVLEWFRAAGEGYQWRINEALREHMSRKRP